MTSGCADDGAGSGETSGDGSTQGLSQGSTDAPSQDSMTGTTADDAGPTTRATLGTSDGDDTSGSDGSDSSPSTSTGSGVFNAYSVELDGVSAFVDLGPRDSVFGAAPMAWTVSAWVRLPSLPAGDELSGDGIFTVEGAGGFGSGADLFWSTELDAVSIAFYPPGTVGGIRGVPADPTTWTHVVAVFDPGATDNHGRLFLDGTLAAEADTEKGTFSAAGNVWVGKYLNDNFVTAGLFDEVAVWNVALSADAVTAIYNEGAPGDLTTTTGAYDAQDALTGYWRMGDDNGGEGTSVTDVTGNSDATLQMDAVFSEDVP